MLVCNKNIIFQQQLLINKLYYYSFFFSQIFRGFYLNGPPRFRVKKLHNKYKIHAFVGLWSTQKSRIFICSLENRILSSIRLNYIYQCLFPSNVHSDYYPAIAKRLSCQTSAERLDTSRGN